MDNLTHTLFAATLARTPIGRAGRATTAALILASNAPDIDLVAAAGGALNYLEWHRGPTHGPLGIVGLGLVTAGLVWAGQRILDRDRAAEPPSFWMLAAVSTLGVLLHVLMDLPTSYGSRLLSPFDWHWSAIDLVPIIDIYLLIALGAGLLIGRGSDTARRRTAVIALAFVMANYGLRAATHRQAIALAPRVFGPLLPERCDPATEPESIVAWWPRETSLASRGPTIPSAGTATRCLVEIAAIPGFVSPFDWRLIAHLSNAYELRDVNVLEARLRAPASDSEAPWRLAVRYPNAWTPAVFKAATTDVGRTFLGFSRFPAARSFVDRAGVTTVRWTEVRFIDPRGASDRRSGFFSATVRIGPDGEVLDARLGL